MLEVIVINLILTITLFYIILKYFNKFYNKLKDDLSTAIQLNIANLKQKFDKKVENLYKNSDPRQIVQNNKLIINMLIQSQNQLQSLEEKVDKVAILEKEITKLKNIIKRKEKK